MSNKSRVNACGSDQPTAERLVEKVRERYGRIAENLHGGCCGNTPQTCCSAGGDDTARKIGYDETDLAAVPEGTNLGLGCGAPIGHLELRMGETVLDLGSGPGFDAMLAARAVGSTGRVIGVDMTPEMIRRARITAQKAGMSHVEFREGRLESLPLDDATVDAVTSNCVVNLVPDKEAVFREIARVLRPGGRLVISDVVLDGELPAALESNLLAYVGCVSGAMQRERYLATIEAAGLTGVDVISDVDFLGTVDDALPEEVLTLMQKSGVRPGDLRGKVRSITFRARKG